MEKVSLFGMSAIVCGEGEPLLMLHGFLSSKESFLRQIGFFGNFYKVIALDLAGFGENGDLKKPYSLETYVEEVINLINFFGGEAIIMGHSFGGRIAIKLASEHPEKVKALVLVDSAGLKPKRGIKYFYRKTGYFFMKKFLPRERLEKKYFSPDYIGLSPNMKGTFNFVTKEFLDCKLSKIDAFTLIVWGKNDKETPLYMAKRLYKGIKNSKLYLIEGAGHFPFIDKFDEFNFVVKEFLSEV